MVAVARGDVGHPLVMVAQRLEGLHVGNSAPMAHLGHRARQRRRPIGIDPGQRRGPDHEAGSLLTRRLVQDVGQGQPAASGRDAGADVGRPQPDDQAVEPGVGGAQGHLGGPSIGELNRRLPGHGQRRPEGVQVAGRARHDAPGPPQGPGIAVAGHELVADEVDPGLVHVAPFSPSAVGPGAMISPGSGRRCGRGPMSPPSRSGSWRTTLPRSGPGRRSAAIDVPGWRGFSGAAGVRLGAARFCRGGLRAARKRPP